MFAKTLAYCIEFFYEIEDYEEPINEIETDDSFSKTNRKTSDQEEKNT